MNVLISLHKGYGIGDGCMVSSILRHVKKHRPHWKVDYQAEEGKHQIGRGLVENHFSYDSPHVRPHYDAEILLTLYDKWWGFTDRPNTHVSSALREHFALEWDEECGRYQVNVREESISRVRQLASIYLNGGNRGQKSNCVAIHYQGDTCPDRKNLTYEQAQIIRLAVMNHHRIPLVLDYRGQSPLNGHKVTNREWGSDIEMQCAVISQCEAFIGIDSGPAKCASATDTPSLVVWTRHHPAQFHDPASNTTHLVPVGFHRMKPVSVDEGVMDWFDDHYNIRIYNHDPIPQVREWLKEVLK